jgi:CDP-glycerol glycerophosphotransferase (TagB/SpsB family)
MIRKLLSLIASILPKQDKIVFIPYPDYEDMTLAFIEKLENKSKKLILLVNKEDSGKYFEKYKSNLKIVLRRSLKGMFHMMTSKIIFCTHGFFLKEVPRNTVIINLWHGFGFKAVGTYLGNNGHASSVVIGSSEYSKQFFAKEMNVSEDHVIPLGFSRNDRLINAFKNKEVIKQTIGFDSFSKIIIWMPTYRSAVEGDYRTDGIQYDNPFNLIVFNVELFTEYLEKNNILCLFRAHPMSLKFELPQNKYFQITNDEWLYNRGLSLYQLLGITDILISDLSSVITDYLLIDKPIIHAMSDFEEYTSTRPMLLNPPKDFMVGPLVKNQEELIKEINNIIEGSDNYIDKRIELKKLFFDKNTDNKSTERILNYLKL